MKILKKNIHDQVTWEYEGKEIRRNPTSITVEALFNRDDMPFMDVVLKRNDRFVETFYSDRWFNIFEIYDRDDGKLKGWYCNITKPAMIDTDSIAYVDLALDLWVNEEGQQTVLDEDELIELGLDDDLNAKIYKAMDELKTAFKNKNLPS